MTFKEWLSKDLKVIDKRHCTFVWHDVQAAWNHQQKTIDKQQQLLKEAIEVIQALDGFVNENWAIDMDIGNEFLNKPEIKEMVRE